MPSGGRRLGAGRPKMTAIDKLVAEKEVVAHLDFGDAPEIPCKPPSWLNDKGKQVYEATYKWLKELGCLKGILPSLLEEFSHLKSKWHECESNISSIGMVIKEDGKAKPNPFIQMSQIYARQSDAAWAKIYAVVRECKMKYSDPYTTGDPNDVMEQLLSGGGKK